MTPAATAPPGRSRGRGASVVGWALHLGGIATVLTAGHVLVMGRLRDRPVAQASLLLSILVVVLLEVWWARRTDAATRGAVQRRFASATAPGLTLLAFFLVLAFVFAHAYIGVASDGRDYFAQARSIAIDHDVDFSNEFDALGTRGAAAHYPIGTALLWTPLFLLAHVWLTVLNLLGGSNVLDGFSGPYQRAVGLATLLYGCAALYLIFRVLRRWFSSWLALATVVLLSSASFLAWYLTVEGSMSHGASFFATTAFLYWWLETRGDRTALQWGILGVLGGLMTLVRYQDGLFLVAPLVEAPVSYWRHARDAAWGQVRRLLARHALFTAALWLAMLPQLLVWSSRQLGGPVAVANTYGVRWLSPSVVDVLFSSNHGLFSWTPVVYLAVLGLPIVVRRRPLVGSALVLAFLAQLYINSVVVGIAGGSGFGARRFSNCALVFALGLAAVLEWLRRRPRLVLAGASSILVLFNLVFMLDVRSQRLPSGEGITFDRLLTNFFERVGNPFSFPGSVVFAYRHGSPLRFYDLVRVRTFSNLRIDLGDEDDDRFLLGGWSTRESVNGVSFRWAVGDESALLVPLWDHEPYRLEFRCAPLASPPAPRQVVEVWVNGRMLDRFVLAKGLQDYVVRIPAELLRDGAARVRFRYHVSRTPRSLGLGPDDRQLAVQFDRMRFVVDR